MAAGLLVALLWSAQVPAQSLNLGGGDGEPVEVEATEALEWHSEEQLYVARGDARLRQGDVEVRADVLTAHYRELPDGATEIWRVTADGNVVIETPTERAQGDHGVYEADRDVFILTGDNLRLDTEDGVITARDSLEYWQGRQLAIARGDAVAVQPAEQGGENRIEAGVLTAQFAEGPGGDLEIQVIEASDGVRITTPTDVATGTEGVYNVATEMATLTGDVTLTRGQNQLNGDFAEVNLATGVSRLLSSPGGASGGGRVRGLLVPNSDQADQ